MAIKSVASVSPEYRDSNSGALHAYTWMEITDIFGKTRMRKISLGRDYHVPLDTARVLIEKARAAQPNMHITAQFVQSL